MAARAHTIPRLPGGHCSWLSAFLACCLALGVILLLGGLGVGGVWGQAHAAPQSGAPLLSIISIDGNTLTLQFDGWIPNEVITLGYSPSVNCSPFLALPNNTFSAEGSSFTANYDWPTSGIAAGTYHLCATGSVSSGPFASQQTITVNAGGAVQSTPGPGTPQPSKTSGPGTSTATVSPSASPGAGATVTPDGSSTGQPGNGGASQSATSSFSVGVLASIILLGVLVVGTFIITFLISGGVCAGKAIKYSRYRRHRQRQAG